MAHKCGCNKGLFKVSWSIKVQSHGTIHDLTHWATMRTPWDSE